MDRSAFTTQVIRALDELSHRQQRVPASKHAASAYSKLQFDFPVSCRRWSRPARRLVSSTMLARAAAAAARPPNPSAARPRAL
jgi:hypothetical protein